MNAPKNKNSEIVAEVKNALAIVLGEAELTLRFETLSQEGKERQETIKAQVWRIDKLLEKIG